MKNKKVKLKKTTIDDISSIYKWINHSSVRKNSFSTKKILKRENKFFWQKNLNSKNYLAYTLFLQNKKNQSCGLFSAKLYKKYFLINYLISPKFRNLGLSKPLLRQGVKKLNNFKKNIKIVAKVKKNNILSILSLHSAGFTMYVEERNCIKMIFKR